MWMTYQNVQKNEIYILVSKSCIAKQLWTLLNLEEHNEPFFHMRGLWNCKVDDSFIGLNLNPHNMSCHHSCLCISAMPWLLLFVSGVCFFAIEHESKIKWTISRTNNCPSTYISRRRILKIYFYFWISTSKASVWSYVFKVFKFLLFIAYDSNVFYR
jgi:hypothetical protein